MLAGVLAVLAVLQLMLVPDAVVEGASAGRAAPLAGYVAPAITLVSVAPVIGARPLFTPARAGAASSSDMLEGVQVAGSWSTGRQARLVLRKPDGTSITLRPGQVFNGWRLAGITSEGARFARAGESATIAFGGSAPSDPDYDEQQTEEEEEEL
ncbi:MAG: hypothetical protein B7Z08_00115 [Sphingomonadales bacterium 32-68-7]|nr:MAG: hypothetical protein B7Z08_00115 [Sphingomonadales bacterium 32-68-7]